jgi:hypothetical protein
MDEIKKVTSPGISSLSNALRIIIGMTLVFRKMLISALRALFKHLKVATFVSKIIRL